MPGTARPSGNSWVKSHSMKTSDPILNAGRTIFLKLRVTTAFAPPSVNARCISDVKSMSPIVQIGFRTQEPDGTAIARDVVGYLNSVKTTRVKVLKFLNHFNIGGTERQFVHVANGLDPSTFDIEIACFRREGPLLQSLRPEMPVHLYPAQGSFYNRHSLASQLRFAKDIRKRRIDIVHTYGWYPDVFAIPPAKLALRPRIIASIRDAGAYLTPSKVRVLKLVCALADAVLANSVAGRDWLVGQGVKSAKVEVIRNGVTVPPEPAKKQDGSRVRKEFGIPPDVPLCACIGRVVSGKGIDFYIRAARVLADQGRDVRFLMIGAISTERSYQSEMKLLARELNVDDRVIFTGQRQDVDDILKEVDIVVHPSLTEGLSNVILEAMAAGLPVVATRAGGNSELVQDEVTGLLVPVENPLEIARAISRILDNPQMARAFGEAGRQRIVQEFSIERMLRQTEDLYLRLYGPVEHDFKSRSRSEHEVLSARQ
jgi:glycosyltransferase involved in cell wall biosynthesis